MRTGILYDEKIEDYHACDAVSHSKLCDFNDGFPLSYYKKYVEKSVARSTTKALNFGSYFHSLALEGEAVADARFVVSPKFDRRTTLGKESALKFEKETAGKECIETDEYALGQRMAKSIQEHPEAMALLQGGRPEVTFRHNLLKTMPLQCRPDYWNPTGHALTHKRPYVIDLKTIDDLRADWAYQFHKFEYHMSAALTRSVISDTIPEWVGPPPDYIYLVVEKTGTFQCQLFRPGEITLDVARRHVVARLKRLKECIEQNYWPGAPTGIHPVDAPQWWQDKSVIL